jgi:hypothetical protein
VRERLLLLVAVLALAVGPVAARAHVYAGAAFGADYCTTSDGKAPAPAGVHAEHCQCCTGSTLGPPPAPTLVVFVSSQAPLLAVPADAERVARVDAARPRGPPVVPRTTR